MGNVSQPAAPAEAAPQPATPDIAGLWFRMNQIDEQVKLLKAERRLLVMQITARLPQE